MQSQWCLLFSYVFDSSPEGNYSSVSKHSAVHYANQLDANCVWCKAEGFLNLFLAKKQKQKNNSCLLQLKTVLLRVMKVNLNSLRTAQANYKL